MNRYGWDRPVPACRGCGAPLTRVVCSYCGRRHDKPAEIRPDPDDDPKRFVTLRKTQR